MKYFISYVIPCYNCQDTITETILSIRDSHEQVMREKDKPSRWTQFEVICIDDGSTDYTPQVLDALAEEFENVKVVHLKKNYGKGYARNLGNEMAQAKIIAVLDSDDWNITDRTATILKCFRQYPERDIFYSGFVARHMDLNHNEPFKGRPLDKEHLKAMGEFGICHSSVAYRKEAILKEPYSEDPNQDDWSMLWNFFSRGYKFVYSPKILVAYRVKPETFKKESVAGKQDRILDKKQKIMEPYFKEKAHGNT